jgi:hypothetical protein
MSRPVGDREELLTSAMSTRTTRRDAVNMLGGNNHLGRELVSYARVKQSLGGG